MRWWPRCDWGRGKSAILSALVPAVLLGLNVGLVATPVHAFDVIQITDNDLSDSNPDISGGNVTWFATVMPSSTWYVQFWDGSTITTIADSGTYLTHPRISGTNVVWESGSGIHEIMLWDGTDIVQISDGSGDAQYPSIDGTNVAWTEEVGGTRYIRYYDGSSLQKLTDDPPCCVLNWHAEVDGSNVIWQHSLGPAGEIHLWDGLTTTEISDGTGGHSYPVMSGSRAAWLVEDDWVCWWDGEELCDYETEVVLWDGTTETILTDDESFQLELSMDGPYLVWRACDGGEGPSCIGGDLEIYYWNGDEVIQITDNSVDDRSPEISGNKVVWAASDGSDLEIYMTTLPGPAVPALSVLGRLALGVVIVFLAIHRRSH